MNKWRILGWFVIVWLGNAVVAKLAMQYGGPSKYSLIEITSLFMQLPLTVLVIVLAVRKKSWLRATWILPIWLFGNNIQPYSFFLEIALLVYLLVSLEKNRTTRIASAPANDVAA